MIRVAFLTLLIVASNYIAAHAQVQPANRSVLNYRLVGFSVPEKEGVTGYEFEVTEMIITDTGTTVYKPIFKKKSAAHQMVGIVPEFGKTYSWSVNYYINSTVSATEGPWMFLTGKSPFVDTTKYKLKIIDNKVENKDMLVFIDASRTLYDLNGNALWFLPDIENEFNEHSSIRDLKTTPFNTITFLTERNAYEIDYNANIIWKAPDNGLVSGDSTERYHHEFTRLDNGNYIVAGTKTVLRDVTKIIEDGIKPGRLANDDITKKNGKTFIKTLYDTVIEYDTSGKTVWQWVSDNYFSDDAFFNPLKNGTQRTHAHMNSIYYDSDQNAIYLSFRNINRVVKINYATKEVLAAYGEPYHANEQIYGSGLFYGQHACKTNREGNMYLFNNNNPGSATSDTDYTKISSIVLFKEPVNKTDTITKLWEFTCDIDSLAPSFTPGGGGVIELLNSNYLVCMASAARNFIVDKNKKIQWNAILMNNNIENGWENYFAGYRSSIIETMKQTEQLLFNVSIQDTNERVRDNKTYK